MSEELQINWGFLDPATGAIGLRRLVRRLYCVFESESPELSVIAEKLFYVLCRNLEERYYFLDYQLHKWTFNKAGVKYGDDEPCSPETQENASRILDWIQEHLKQECFDMKLYLERVRGGIFSDENLKEVTRGCLTDMTLFVRSYKES